MKMNHSFEINSLLEQYVFHYKSYFHSVYFSQLATKVQQMQLSLTVKVSERLLFVDPAPHVVPVELLLLQICILYPELSFLIRYTTSLSTLILQDFCKI
jgi:hypothetical protein